MALIFRQLREEETGTYTYVIGDKETKEIAIVDSVRDHLELYKNLIRTEGWILRYLLETHVHADHVTAAGPLQDLFPQSQIGVFAKSGVKGSLLPLEDGTELKVGNVTIKALHTPGHTKDDMTFWVNGDRLLTGDTMLINSCGRTDFQAGDSTLMHRSLARLMDFDPDTLVYPGHDYQGRFVSSIREQSKNNELLTLGVEAFTAKLKGWNLPPPKRLKESVPSNLEAGRVTLRANT